MNPEPEPEPELKPEPELDPEPEPEPVPLQLQVERLLVSAGAESGGEAPAAGIDAVAGELLDLLGALAKKK